MTELPFTLREPALARFMTGELTRFRRPASGMYRRLKIYELLWIREPYYLKREYERFSPSAAESLGARPYFAADLGPGETERLNLGTRRFARNLLRCWHRQHAIIENIETQRLLDITDAEIRNEGFSSRDQWMARWDLDTKSFGGAGIEDNPTVFALTLRRIGGMVPGEAALNSPLRKKEPA